MQNNFEECKTKNEALNTIQKLGLLNEVKLIDKISVTI